MAGMVHLQASEELTTKGICGNAKGGDTFSMERNDVTCKACVKIMNTPNPNPPPTPPE